MPSLKLKPFALLLVSAYFVLCGLVVIVAVAAPHFLAQPAYAAAAPQLNITNPSVGLGDTLQITLSNLQAGDVATYSLNGSNQKQFPTSGSLSLPATQANGFVTGSNSFSVRVLDGNGNPLGNIVGSPAVISVSPAAGGNPGNPGAPNGSTQNGATDSLYNPLPEDDLTHAFLVIVQGFLGIIAIWSVIFIIVGGFQMVMASGSEEVYTKAKKTIIWAILGLVIALMSFSIVAIIENILQATIKP